MVMPNRSFSISKPYSFGFNGQLRDNEVYGVGNLNTALFWQYDTRLGRRWNRDPKVKVWESGYATFRNNPTIFIDPSGDDYFINRYGQLLGKDNTESINIRLVTDDNLQTRNAFNQLLTKMDNDLSDQDQFEKLTVESQASIQAKFDVLKSESFANKVERKAGLVVDVANNTISLVPLAQTSGDGEGKADFSPYENIMDVGKVKLTGVEGNKSRWYISQTHTHPTHLDDVQLDPFQPNKTTISGSSQEHLPTPSGDDVIRASKGKGGIGLPQFVLPTGGQSMEGVDTNKQPVKGTNSSNFIIKSLEANPAPN
jgi:hypothetical protein